MESRAVRLLVALAAVSAAVALAFGAGPVGLLYLAPVALLAGPLLSGRYLGERSIRRLGARRVARSRRAHAAPAPRPTRGPGRAFPRGGLLVAASLAERGPPAAVLAR